MRGNLPNSKRGPGERTDAVDGELRNVFTHDHSSGDPCGVPTAFFADILVGRDAEVVAVEVRDPQEEAQHSKQAAEPAHNLVPAVDLRKRAVGAQRHREKGPCRIMGGGERGEQQPRQAKPARAVQLGSHALGTKAQAMETQAEPAAGGNENKKASNHVRRNRRGQCSWVRTP